MTWDECKVLKNGAICAIECQKKHQNVSRVGNHVLLYFQSGMTKKDQNFTVWKRVHHIDHTNVLKHHQSQQ